MKMTVLYENGDNDYQPLDKNKWLRLKSYIYASLSSTHLFHVRNLCLLHLRFQL